MLFFTRYLPGLLITAWAGGLWLIGYLAVPLLFYSQPDRQLAGQLAAEMFNQLAWLGLACATYLLSVFAIQLKQRIRHYAPAWIILGMLLISLSIQAGVQPQMAELKALGQSATTEFKWLHGTASLLYLLQSLLAIALVITHNRALTQRKPYDR